MIDITKIKLNKIDTRSQEEKDKEIDFHKLYGITPLTWTAKPLSEWNRAKQRDQSSSYSCVDHSIAEVGELQTGIVLSAHPIYARRSNSPEEGSIPSEAINSFVLQGTTTEVLDPSNGLSEEQMNAPVGVATPIRALSNGGVSVDINSIASAIATHKGVIIALNLSWEEWTGNPGVPQVILDAEIAGGHELSGVDYVVYEGQNCIVAQNHWGVDDGFSVENSGLVILTPEYLAARCTSVYYNVPPVIPMKPSHTFIANLSSGMVGAEILVLQQCLNYDPETAVAVSGVGSPGNETNTFGMLTYNAVIKFQGKYNIPETGYVGPLTRAQLNALFGLPLTVSDVIAQVETGGEVSAIGDEDLPQHAYGILQIRQPVCDDVNGKYGTAYVPSDLVGLGALANSIDIFNKYMDIYCPNASEDIEEVMARTWNGGPNGPNEDTTLPYWTTYQAKKLALVAGSKN